MKRSRRIFSLGVLTLIAACIVGFASCSSAIPRRDPLGERFPTVSGQSLEAEVVVLPEALAGSPAVLLIGYKQNTQFDLDRWILGLLQAETPVRFLEVPTIPGMVPGMISGYIDDGMRSGIPTEDWGVVVTLYGDDASRIANWTGTKDGLNGRIVLLDSDGVARWFHDRGYSGSKVLELDAEVRALEGETAGG
jgi:hypothetical protein